MTKVKEKASTQAGLEKTRKIGETDERGFTLVGVIPLSIPAGARPRPRSKHEKTNAAHHQPVCEYCGRTYREDKQSQAATPE